ncbi:prolyl oligopeptidase [Xylaria bambusicola]|uniref:prolyl oligopeptidase n=1 Tax=Xylaria bambusicola TaxID=326684 RepID=UPI0020083FC1|nr:prolyl oligopeptidase [Xylaria bambusicola]KAI0515323.1 prolyl oligopeptidase [Xylaria bambusicola]
MVIDRLTPEIFISAPRRGPAVPNDDGTLALYTESIHQIGGKTRRYIYILNIATRLSSCILHDDQAYEPSWLGDGTNTIIYLKSGGMGITFLLVINVDRSPPEPSIVGHIQGPVRGLKTKALGNGILAFTILGCVDTDGKLRNTKNRKVHNGRVYCSPRLRYDDLKNEPHPYTIWYSTLSRQEGDWRIAGDLHNALDSTGLRIPLEESGLYEDAKSQYDMCENGIIITAESPEYQNPGPSGTSNIYFIRIRSFENGIIEAPTKIETQSEGCQAICTMPQFSPDGALISFLCNQTVNREWTEIYVYHTSASQSAVNVFGMVTGRPWDLAPTSFRFSANGHSLYITAEDCGQVGLYRLNLQPHAYPVPLLRYGTVSAYYPLRRSDNGEVLVTSSSFVESCFYQVISDDAAVMLSSSSDHGSKLGLSPKQVSEIYYEGGGDYIVHAWVMKPQSFDETKKYPLAILVHDAAGFRSWLNAWDMKWNAAAWAEQGYVVVLPNITGSTGYGQDFAAAVHNDWSGRPYDDLVNCLYNLRDMPGVDVDNAIIAGSGHGGYLMNWIQGHPLARRFKAMVCHAGVFNTQSMSIHGKSGEELPSSGTDLAALHRCNPARSGLLQNWKTPMLVIHNERDSVFPVSEGLAAYNNLQSLGVSTKFLTFSNEGHDVSKAENSLEWHRQVFAWVNGYTKNTTTTAGIGQASDTGSN